MGQNAVFYKSLPPFPLAGSGLLLQVERSGLKISAPHSLLRNAPQKLKLLLALI